MKFIKTDRGDYVSCSAIARVEREAHDRVSGRPDDGIRKFTLYNREDHPLGSIKVRENRMDFILAEFVPAQPGQKLITLHFDESDKSVWDLEYDIVAWALVPGSPDPYPVTIEGDVYSGTGKSILIRMPDGKLNEPYVGIYDSLEDAKKEFLRNFGRGEVTQ